MINKEDFSVIEDYLNGIDFDDYDIVLITPKRRQRRIENAKHKVKLSKIHDYNHCYAGQVIKKENHKKEPYYFSGNRSTTSKWIKNRANRKVRRTKGIGNPGTYRKVSDYWWELV